MSRRKADRMSGHGTEGGDTGGGEDKPLSGQKLAVVGGGFGGLSTACYLADMGSDVRLFEKNSEVGGVAGRITDDRYGFRFDAGPSWYLMPETFERFFGHFGHSPEDYYELVELDPHYRVYWKDGDSVDVPDDPEEVAEIFESYEEGAGDAFRRYLDKTEYTFEVGMNRFVYDDKPRMRDFIDTDVLKSAHGLPLVRKMQGYAEKHFAHPKLQQLVQYTLVFLGGSPHNTPALYSLLAHVDFNLGVYYPKGGVWEVVDGMRSLAAELGATVETDAEVRRIEPKPSSDEVVLTVSHDGSRSKRYSFDRVVCNANPAHVERELLSEEHVGYGEDYWSSRTYAPSAYMLYLGVEGDVDGLRHHTLVLPEDWDPHFEDIFDEPGWPDEPAYYVNAPSLTDPSVAPEGYNTVVVLVPVAPGIDDGEEVRREYRDALLDDLARNTGVDLRERIVFEEDACVSEFSRWVNAPQGTALGLAHTLRQTGPLRPGRKARGLDRLYYVGNFTTPGIGMPMCLVSGEHTAEAILSDVQERGKKLQLPT